MEQSKQMTTPNLSIHFGAYFRCLTIFSFICISCATCFSQDDDNNGEEPGFSFKNLPIDYFGSISTRHGLRIKDDPYHTKNTVLNETRLRLGMDVWLDWGEIKFKNDFIYDFHQEKYVNDLRLANVLLTPWDFLDIKVGRQILTWGK